MKVKGKGSKQCSQQATALQDSCKENQDGALKAKRIDPLRPREQAHYQTDFRTSIVK